MVGADCPPKRRNEKKKSAKDSDGKIKYTSVLFVGAIGLVLAIGAVVFTFKNPSESDRMWAIVAPLLTAAFGYLMFWSRGKRTLRISWFKKPIKNKSKIARGYF